MARKNNVKPDQVLARAIEASGVAEVIRSSSDKTSARALYRVHEKRIWLGILEFVLSRAEGWSAHVCQQYFMRGGRLVYGWNFILQAPDGIETAVKAAAKLLTHAAEVVPRVVARQQAVDTYPLMGASNRRTAAINFDPRLPGPDRGGPSHKGAYGIKSGEQG